MLQSLGWLSAAAILLPYVSYAILPIAKIPTKDLSMVHVMYATTSNGFSGLVHSMNSLARHSSDPKQLTIHVVVDKEEFAWATKLVECFKYEQERNEVCPIVILHEMRKLPWDTNNILADRAFGRPEQFKSYPVWARFYVQEFVTAPRAIWLDVDTIVQGDLGELYRMPMSFPVAARNMSSKSQAVPEAYINLTNATHLNRFNTGVLVFDMAFWESGYLSRRLEQISSACRCCDQVVMNLLFLDNYDKLLPKWNYGFGITQKYEHRANPGENQILHWQGPSKPWHQQMCNVTDSSGSTYECLGPENLKFYASYASHRGCDSDHGPN